MDNNNSHNKPAGMYTRLFAGILDYLILLVITISPIILIVSTNNNVLSHRDSILSLINIVYYLIIWILLLNFIVLGYFAVMISKTGATLGKSLFGIKVVDATTDQLLDLKRSFYRCTLGYRFSSSFFGLGFLSILKHPSALAYHDIALNTKVIRYKKPLAGYTALALACAVLCYEIYVFVMQVSTYPIFR